MEVEVAKIGWDYWCQTKLVWQGQNIWQCASGCALMIGTVTCHSGSCKVWIRIDRSVLTPEISDTISFLGRRRRYPMFRGADLLSGNPDEGRSKVGLLSRVGRSSSEQHPAWLLARGCRYGFPSRCSSADG